MRKAILLSLCLAFLVGCSQDSDTTSEIESVDLTQIINPDTARAEAEHDNTSSGIYKGVFVSNDISYHGILTVNLGNDSRYNAILEYGENKSRRIGFVRVNNDSETSELNMIEFRGRNAGFTLNVSNYAQPIVTDGYIDGQTAQARLFKETSANSVRMVLGTFSDDLDPTGFHGTWDLFSTPGNTTVLNIPLGGGSSIGVTVNVIDQVIITKSGGAMYTDETMEIFVPSPQCEALLPLPADPTDPFVPFFSGVQDLGGSFVLNEFAVPVQTSLFLDEDATWSLIYSTYAGNLYYDDDCNPNLSGGTWSWKGRSGRILLE